VPLQRITEPKAALAYIKGQLAQGMGLAKMILQRTDLELGHVFVEMRDAWTPDIADFDVECVRLSRDEKRVLAILAKTFLERSDFSVLIQDWDLSYSSKFPDMDEEEVRNLVVNGRDVYWRISHGSYTDDQLEKFIWGPTPYPLTVFFYRSPGDNRRPQLSSGDLERIHNELVGFAVGAFDARSFLRWWDTERMPLPRLRIVRQTAR
jgi:hypothetical protein